KLLSFFKLATPELTIDQTEKAKQILDVQQEKIDEISKLKKQFEDFKKESQNEIEKLKYFNDVSSAYLQRGEFPELEKRGDKRVFKYKSLDNLKKSNK
ncbi:MAG: hypothetical protein PVH93_03190, partial [Nitrosopumilaceae archaeon]